MIDENQSQEDIDRFSSDTASCAYCGAEIYDDCLECPECHVKNIKWIDGLVHVRKPF